MTDTNIPLENGNSPILAYDMSVTNVEDYLASVRQEENLLPNVIIASAKKPSASIPVKNSTKFERLQKISNEASDSDPRFVINGDALNYFKHMKAQLHSNIPQAQSQHNCALVNYCVNTFPKESDISSTENFLQNLRDDQWSELFASNPPDALEIASAGFSFRNLQQILHNLANLICEGKGSNIDEKTSTWLFAILLLLDDLFAIQESISYELQRIKRALDRYIPSMIDSLASGDTKSDKHMIERETAEMVISGHVLNLCIIRQHFKQC
ncbi:hypothetical protein BBOV_II006050 [Babesia bovis T2Bo]|uniref:Uncharacterized protein n=1 Tax=Babesia bovis TaxID=5865 RepID=A7AUE4_BABBO|nr:hypothetical protein BBOV_II006050 [Babesia bovis T2Bo]EDO06555.1 hypothetical protein BBOV_II006050 [Babesia bovis T2Bo]|eukprot:XP_001610123.1 hypothetical protein [Babesia bovis T2Bo]